MKKKGIKIQITLPENVLNKIDEIISVDCRSRSAWFLKLSLEELEKRELEEKSKKIRKTIELDL